MANSNNESMKQVIPLNQVLAWVIALITVLLPPVVFWQYGPDLFGPHPLIALLVITGVGGAISGAIMGAKGKWFLVAIAGLVAGVGSAGLLIFYAVMLKKQSMGSLEIAIVEIIGALPGAFIIMILGKTPSQPQR